MMTYYVSLTSSPRHVVLWHHTILSQASLLKGGCPLRLSFALLPCYLISLSLSLYIYINDNNDNYDDDDNNDNDDNNNMYTCVCVCIYIYTHIHSFIHSFPIE